MGVQLQLSLGAVFLLHPARAGCGKVRRQVQRLLHIDGEQWRHVPGIMGNLECVQAGADALGIIGRMPKPGQDLAQGGITDALRVAIGINPVHGDTRQFGQLLQKCISHGQAPA
ncbi:hypothetical protein D9M71_479900 [compost metagenome]